MDLIRSTQRLLGCRKRVGLRGGLRFSHPLLSYHLIVLVKIAGVDPAVVISILVLSDPFRIFVKNPHIHAVIPVGVGLLPHSLAVFIDHPEIKIIIPVRIPLLFNKLLILENRQRIKFPITLFVPKSPHQRSFREHLDEIKLPVLLSTLLPEHELSCGEGENPVAFPHSVVFFVLSLQMTTPLIAHNNRIYVGMADNGMHTVREHVKVPELVDAAHFCEVVLKG